MLRCSRGAAAELVTAGRVEINHLPADKPHAPVYEGDVFTVRGKGRFGLTALPGKSKKDRCQVQGKTRGRSGQAGKENRRQGKDRGKSKN